MCSGRTVKGSNLPLVLGEIDAPPPIVFVFEFFTVRIDYCYLYERVGVTELNRS
jgi:hypothetical protein